MYSLLLIEYLLSLDPTELNRHEALSSLLHGVPGESNYDRTTAAATVLTRSFDVHYVTVNLERFLGMREEGPQIGSGSEVLSMRFLDGMHQSVLGKWIEKHVWPACVSTRTTP